MCRIACTQYSIIQLVILLISDLCIICVEQLLRPYDWYSVCVNVNWSTVSFPFSFCLESSHLWPAHRSGWSNDWADGSLRAWARFQVVGAHAQSPHLLSRQPRHSTHDPLQRSHQLFLPAHSGRLLGAFSPDHHVGDSELLIWLHQS